MTEMEYVHGDYRKIHGGMTETVHIPRRTAQKVLVTKGGALSVVSFPLPTLLVAAIRWTCEARRTLSGLDQRTPAIRKCV